MCAYATQNSIIIILKHFFIYIYLCGSCWSHIHTFETNATFLQTHRFLYIQEKKIFLGVVDLLCALFFRSIVSMLLCYCAVHLSRGIARFPDVVVIVHWHDTRTFGWERENKALRVTTTTIYSTCIFNAFEKSSCGAENGSTTNRFERIERLFNVYAISAFFIRTLPFIMRKRKRRKKPPQIPEKLIVKGEFFCSNTFDLFSNCCVLL